MHGTAQECLDAMRPPDGLLKGLFPKNIVEEVAVDHHVKFRRLIAAILGKHVKLREDIFHVRKRWTSKMANTHPDKHRFIKELQEVTAMINDGKEKSDIVNKLCDMGKRYSAPPSAQSQLKLTTSEAIKAAFVLQEMEEGDATETELTEKERAFRDMLNTNTEHKKFGALLDPFASGQTHFDLNKGTIRK